MNQVFTKDNMMQVLLDVCPSFGATWAEFMHEWGNELDKPIYLSLADFARHLIGMHARKETVDFPRIFQAIELLHTQGDSYVKEATTIGILESLQNTNLHTSTTPEQFLRYLGPESIRRWHKLEGFWNRGEVIADD